MRARWLVLAGLAAFFLFWLIGGQDFLFHGHDHWVSGQVLLHAQAYLHAHFATPLGVPVEDPYGPVGNWFTFCSWPPGWPLSLAAYQEVAGTSIAAARLLACLLSAGSAVLVVWMSWRSTRDGLAAVVSWLIFVGHPAVAKYCSLICYDSPGLMWSLLLIASFPALVLGTSRRGLALYCMLAAVGGFLEWECYLAPVACALALSIGDRAQLARCWRRALAPLLVLGMVGVSIILTFQSAESLTHQNGRIGGRFFERTGLADPVGALRYAATHVVVLVSASVGLAVAVLLALGLRRALRQPTTDGPPMQTPPRPFVEAEFFQLALGLFPLLWLLAMPDVHSHDFMMLYSVPFLAVFCARLVVQGRHLLEPSWRGRLYAGGVVLGFALLAAVVAVQTYVSREDEEIFRRLEADIHELTDENTVVRMAFHNRGAWWRLHRPVIEAERDEAAVGREHVLVVGLEPTAWEEDYKELKSWADPSATQLGYRILAPK
jgi:hypothetical protein